MLLDKYKVLMGKLLAETKDFYGGRLISLAVFGSVGRGVPNYDSDVDILIVAENLPDGRMKRVTEFNSIEDKMEPYIQSIKKFGINTYLSPIIKSKEEVLLGSPLFLDMISDAIILYDKDNFFVDILKNLKNKLDKLGSQKIIRGNAFFWNLKPDLKQGEDIVL